MAKRKAEIPCLSGTLNISKSPNTPKRIVLSIEEKQDVLKKFDTLPRNMSQEGASKMLQIPRMTLRNILYPIQNWSETQAMYDWQIF